MKNEYDRDASDFSAATIALIVVALILLFGVLLYAMGAFPFGAGSSVLPESGTETNEGDVNQQFNLPPADIGNVAPDTTVQ